MSAKHSDGFSVAVKLPIFSGVLAFQGGLLLVSAV